MHLIACRSARIEIERLSGSVEGHLEILIGKCAHEIGEKAGRRGGAAFHRHLCGHQFAVPISRLVAVSARPSDVVSMRMLLRIARWCGSRFARETTCRAWPRTAGLHVTFI